MCTKLMAFRRGNRLTVQLLASLSAVLLMTACSTNQKAEVSVEKFPVTHPLVMDTLYSQDYVADIQAVQNIDIRVSG